jgi:hypothetical protein
MGVRAVGLAMGAHHLTTEMPAALLASDHPKAATLSIPVLVSGASQPEHADAITER